MTSKQWTLLVIGILIAVVLIAIASRPPAPMEWGYNQEQVDSNAARAAGRAYIEGQRR